MGYQKVEWGDELQEIDLLATLPKKDPDNYEYHETWCISFKPNSVLKWLEADSDFLIDKFLRPFLNPAHREGVYANPNTSLTILLIIPPNQPEGYEQKLRRRVRRIQNKTYFPTVRVRIWNKERLTPLIQQHSQIVTCSPK